jgi:hypothetical protein
VSIANNLAALPVIWLTAGDDAHAAKQADESAWAASKVCSPSAAAALARLWAAHVEAREYRWRQTPAGWLCDAEWSLRSAQTPEAMLLNKLISAACRSQ